MLSITMDKNFVQAKMMFTSMLFQYNSVPVTVAFTFVSVAIYLQTDTNVFLWSRTPAL